MIRKKRKEYVSRFTTETELEVGNKTVKRGDVIKIKNEKGSSFVFWGVTTNPENNIKWVDCFYLKKSQLCGQYSYSLDRVIPPIKKRQRVSRT